MSEVKEKKDTALVISDEIVNLSKAIGDNIVVNDTGAVVQLEGKDVFMDNAPADIKDAIVKVQSYESTFATALLHNVGQKAVAALEKDRGLRRINGVIATGETSLAVNYVPPTGKKADGTMKDPAVAVAYRRKEHTDHVAVRHEINAKTHELFN